MDNYEARVARVIRSAERPALSELIADGADLDDRVRLDGEPDPVDEDDVPEDTVPGE